MPEAPRPTKDFSHRVSANAKEARILWQQGRRSQITFTLFITVATILSIERQLSSTRPHLFCEDLQISRMKLRSGLLSHT